MILGHICLFWFRNLKKHRNSDFRNFVDGVCQSAIDVPGFIKSVRTSYQISNLKIPYHAPRNPYLKNPTFPLPSAPSIPPYYPNVSLHHMTILRRWWTACSWHTIRRPMTQNMRWNMFANWLYSCKGIRKMDSGRRINWSVIGAGYPPVYWHLRLWYLRPDNFSVFHKQIIDLNFISENVA